MSIGNQVRKYRKIRGWTLAELGERVNLAVGTLSDIENDKENVSLKGLERIAEAFGIGMERLVKKDSEY